MIAAAAASNFGSPGTPPFLGQVPACGRRVCALSPVLTPPVWLLWGQIATAVLPTRVPRSSACVAQGCEALPQPPPQGKAAGRVAGGCQPSWRPPSWQGLALCGWQGRGQGACQGRPHTDESRYAHAASHTVAKAPSCACSSAFWRAVTSSSVTQPAPLGAGAGPCCHPAPARLRGTQHRFQKAKPPSPATPAGRGSWARARAESRAGHRGQEQAGRWWQQLLPPGMDIFLCLLPSSSCHPKSWLLLWPRPDLGWGERLSRFGGARLQPVPGQSPNHRQGFSTVRDENNRLLGLVWVSFASVRETHRCSGNPARPVIFPSPLQLDWFGFCASCEEPLCPVVPAPEMKLLKSETSVNRCANTSELRHSNSSNSQSNMNFNRRERGKGEAPGNARIQTEQANHPLVDTQECQARILLSLPKDPTFPTVNKGPDTAWSSRSG